MDNVLRRTLLLLVAAALVVLLAISLGLPRERDQHEDNDVDHREASLLQENAFADDDQRRWHELAPGCPGEAFVGAALPGAAWVRACEGFHMRIDGVAAVREAAGATARSNTHGPL